MKHSQASGWFFVAVLACCCQSQAATTSFLFGSGGMQDAITGRASADVPVGRTIMSLSATPLGSRLDNSDMQGLGVSSANPSSGTTDSDRSKINLVAGLSSGKFGEGISFSFDRPGVLHDLLFDGLKDETLEYLSLTFPNGEVRTIFDSQARLRLANQNYSLSDLSLANPVECETESDDLTGIHYRYEAGEVFVLKYGEGDYELVPHYRTNPRFPQFPNAVGDGIRFQGVTITVLPEPTAWVMLLFTLGPMALRSHRATRCSRSIAHPLHSKLPLVSP